MANAVEVHNYFRNVYPKAIADRTARIVKFASILESTVDYAVRRENLYTLDFVNTIILPTLEEQIEFIRSVTGLGWGRRQ
jgi:hypothetical protein